ncbi:hypothetical protein [Paraburkholderia azotifigens]|uniref:Uncharacterized protein n=1 Tax=Paraburkholderia azotifigens TaxID=2057004 RepID=A0A5C6V6W3_9BURK|nr:hypothetical protein [Paraburkholderia azotifigens]TXC80973.1 hypothetical protein FRZ40_43000 [Paraburkholderia azotifigens]
MFVWLRDDAAERRSACPRFRARDHKRPGDGWQPEIRLAQGSDFIIGATKTSGVDVRGGK